MSERDYNILIEDILESIEKIEQYVSGLNYEEFCKDNKTIDAVIRNFEIIGEAVNKIPNDIKIQNKHIEWNKIVGLRNRIIHDYFGVDLEIIWYIIEKELSEFRDNLKKLV